MKNTNKEFDTDISDKKTKTPLISTTPNIYQILKRFLQSQFAKQMMASLAKGT